MACPYFEGILKEPTVIHSNETFKSHLPQNIILKYLYFHLDTRKKM